MLFPLKKKSLAIDSPAITGEPTIQTNDTVARNHYRERICSTSLTDFLTRSAQLKCEFSVGCRLTWRNLS
jgi:hypothetical protein